jgi:hypothetical protein
MREESRGSDQVALVERHCDARALAAAGVEE